MQPAVNGSMVDLNDIALRNIRIRAEQTGPVVQPGRNVELALVATNQSPLRADTLVAVTSGIGNVTLAGNTAIPVGGILIVDSPERAHAGALETPQPVNAATATVMLSKPITNGLTYDLTFEFAHAGEATVGVPVVSADTDVPATSRPDGETLR
ncbi:MAG TPA: hypothetical protein VH185_00630 [Mycobacterium sp.]|jgi:hypothetical protein|nr:hypothetical protein [Mycobacterium sp.]